MNSIIKDQDSTGELFRFAEISGPQVASPPADETSGAGDKSRLTVAPRLAALPVTNRVPGPAGDETPGQSDTESTDAWQQWIAKLVEKVEGQQQTWLARAERHVVQVAVAIAERIVRSELTNRPEISCDLIREALQLAAGGRDLHVAVHPEDHRVLGDQLKALTEKMARLGPIEIVPDPSVSPGGCRVEWRYGSIDQTVEAQLKRIVDELEI